MQNITARQNRRITVLRRNFAAFAMDNRWITIKPNGPSKKGKAVEIDDEGRVVKGMGGKFKGEKINEVRKDFTGPKTPKKERSITEKLKDAIKKKGDAKKTEFRKTPSQLAQHIKKFSPSYDLSKVETSVITELGKKINSGMKFKYSSNQLINYAKSANQNHVLQGRDYGLNPSFIDVLEKNSLVKRVDKENGWKFSLTENGSMVIREIYKNAELTKPSKNPSSKRTATMVDAIDAAFIQCTPEQRHRIAALYAKWHCNTSSIDASNKDQPRGQPNNAGQFAKSSSKPSKKSTAPKHAVMPSKGLVSEKAFAQWMKKPEGEIPLVMLPKADAVAIGSSRQIAILSSQTATKQLQEHPELTAREYLSAQKVVTNATLKVQDGVNSMVYLKEITDDTILGGHVLVVKTTKTGEGLFVTSYRRLSRDAAKRDSEIARLKRKAKK